MSYLVDVLATTAIPAATVFHRNRGIETTSSDRGGVGKTGLGADPQRNELFGLAGGALRRNFNYIFAGGD